MTHGIPKLLRMLEGDFSFRDPIGIGSVASLVLVTLIPRDGGDQISATSKLSTYFRDSPTAAGLLPTISGM